MRITTRKIIWERKYIEINCAYRWVSAVRFEMLSGSDPDMPMPVKSLRLQIKEIPLYRKGKAFVFQLILRLKQDIIELTLWLLLQVSFGHHS